MAHANNIHHRRRIVLIAALLCAVAVLAWPTVSYVRLPCHRSDLGGWQPVLPDFEHKISWGFRLRDSGKAVSFASCLRSSGYAVYHNNFGDGDNYLATKGQQRIANTDGFGHIDSRYFYVW
jgi:hypothetical protein